MKKEDSHNGGRVRGAPVTGPLSTREKNLVLSQTAIVKKTARQLHYRKMTHVEIEDLVQSAYVGILQIVKRYQPEEGSFARFSFLRARGAMVDPHKRRAYLDETLSSLDAIFERQEFLRFHLAKDNGLLPDEIAARREQARLLAEALGELTSDERKVFMASLDGMPLTQIAADCGLSMWKVRKKLANARVILGARVSRFLRPERTLECKAFSRQFVRRPSTSTS